MVEEVYKNIFRIGVPLEGNPLKEINSYFIRGKDSDLLIDTGFRRDSCRIPLEEGLKELGSDQDRRDVYITHLHSDHSGMADLFVGKDRHIYMSEPDVEYNLIYAGKQYADKDKRFLEEGFSKEMLDYLESNSPSSIYIMKDWTIPQVTKVHEGDVIEVGDYRFEVIFTPGHTPGNTMLWEANEKIMFTGDNILYDITPNITFWNTVKDSLGNYLESLEKAKKFPVEKSFPGHRKVGDYRTRIDELLKHHEARVAEAYQVLCDNPGLRAMDIAGMMSWRIRAATWDTFPLVQKRFAVGECLSHLDYLMIRDKIRREMDENGQWRYYKK